MRRLICYAASGAAVIGFALAPAAASAATSAATSGSPTTTLTTTPLAGEANGGADPDTTVTFTVTTGALTMTAPGAADLGSGAPGTTITGSLGTVTVTDDRALLAATWTATASSTDFTTGGGTGLETIPATDATYTPGTVTKTGTITATPSTITLSGAAQPVVTGTAGSGDNTASWDPTIAVAVPSTAVAGLYTATLTHSVS